MIKNKIRLQKYMALCGVASRRASEILIRSGRVSINGLIVSEMGTMVDGTESVTVDGNIIKPEERKIYVLLHKPQGYMCTVKDPEGRPTVIDLLEGLEQRVYPVGRLDWDSSGIILLTNDGDFSFRLMHPRHGITKRYLALIEGVPSGHTLNELRRGVILDGRKTRPAQVFCEQLDSMTSEIEIIIKEGRNRQVRRMCEAVGHPVIALKRISIGKLTLGDLEEGQWRYLSPEEVEYFREVAELDFAKTDLSARSHTEQHSEES